MNPIEMEEVLSVDEVIIEEEKESNNGVKKGTEKSRIEAKAVEMAGEKGKTEGSKEHDISGLNS